MAPPNPEEGGRPNVLLDPLFVVAPDGPTRPLSLGVLIARLLAGPEDVESFPHVAAEQRSHWYRFLVRCAGKSLRMLGVRVTDASGGATDDLAADITRVLADAAGGAEAWALYQPDPQRPGFLQPPTPDGAPPEASYGRNAMSLLTSALGSKNHERKVDVARSMTPEQAVYALIECQAGAIFGGRGNYASQLMGSASGAGSGTPFMGVQLGNGVGETFRHDVAVLLGGWDRVRAENGLRGDVWALWTERWDGGSQLPAEALDPAFIPTARLMRLGPSGAGGRLDTVWFRPTAISRVRDHTGGGNLGDIFCPLVPNPKQPDTWKVRGTLEKGYDYPEVVRLLFGADARPSPTVAALRHARSAARPDIRVIFEGTAFHQGMTGGIHRREILLPVTSFRAFLGDPDPVRQAHRTLLDLASKAKSAVRGAARILLSGSAKPREGDTSKVEPPAKALDDAVDAIYLEFLLTAGERHARDDLGYVAEWGAKLTEMAREVFRDTLAWIPTSGARRYEREIRAEAWLNYRLRVLRGEVAPAGGPADDSLEIEGEEVTA